MLESELKADVINNFEKLQDKLSSLHEHMKEDKHLMAWMQDGKSLVEYSNSIIARVKAFALLNQLEYTAEQEPREIIIGAGFVGCSSTTIEQANRVNEAKDNFKAAILTLKEAKLPLKDEMLNSSMENILNKRSSIAKGTLNKIGLARLHLKQCYRRIPILEEAPLKISWTWANTRSIKRITVAQAQEMLNKKSKDAGILNQIQKLNNIYNQEELAIVQDLAPHLRANIVLPDENSVKRIMIKGPVPIFFPCDRDTAPPIFKAPKEKTAKSQDRLTRADVRIDPEAFLPAIRAHRYLKYSQAVEEIV